MKKLFIFMMVLFIVSPVYVLAAPTLTCDDFSDGPYSITQNGASISVTPKIAAS